MSRTSCGVGVGGSLPENIQFQETKEHPHWFKSINKKQRIEHDNSPQPPTNETTLINNNSNQTQTHKDSHHTKGLSWSCNSFL